MKFLPFHCCCYSRPLGCTSPFSTATSVGFTGSGFQKCICAQRVAPVTTPGSGKGINSRVLQLNLLHPNSVRGDWAGRSPVLVWVSLSSSEPSIRDLPNYYYFFFIAKFICYTHFPSLLLYLAYWNGEFLSSVFCTYQESAWSKPGHNLLLWYA